MPVTVRGVAGSAPPTGSRGWPGGAPAPLRVGEHERRERADAVAAELGNVGRLGRPDVDELGPAAQLRRHLAQDAILHLARGAVRVHEEHEARQGAGRALRRRRRLRLRGVRCGGAPGREQRHAPGSDPRAMVHAHSDARRTAAVRERRWPPLTPSSPERPEGFAPIEEAVRTEGRRPGGRRSPRPRATGGVSPPRRPPSALRRASAARRARARAARVRVTCSASRPTPWIIVDDIAYRKWRPTK